MHNPAAKQATHLADAVLDGATSIEKLALGQDLAL
jgi:hypothetical protein